MKLFLISHWSYRLSYCWLWTMHKSMFSLVRAYSQLNASCHDTIVIIVITSLQAYNAGRSLNGPPSLSTIVIRRRTSVLDRETSTVFSSWPWTLVWQNCLVWKLTEGFPRVSSYVYSLAKSINCKNWDMAGLSMFKPN